MPPFTGARGGTEWLEYECAVAVAVSRPLASRALLGEFGPVCNTPICTTVIQIPHEVSFGVHFPTLELQSFVFQDLSKEHLFAPNT